MYTIVNLSEKELLINCKSVIVNSFKPRKNFSAIFLRTKHFYLNEYF